jgi:hypothetical protein
MDRLDFGTSTAFFDATSRVSMKVGGKVRAKHLIEVRGGLQLTL